MFSVRKKMVGSTNGAGTTKWQHAKKMNLDKDLLISFTKIIKKMNHTLKSNTYNYKTPRK